MPTQSRTTQDTKSTRNKGNGKGKGGRGNKLTSPDLTAGAFSISNSDLSGRVVSLVATSKNGNENRKK